jgi:hypothetical protein
MKVDKAAAEATVLDLEGGVHELRELWQDGTKVLVWLRHFG